MVRSIGGRFFALVSVGCAVGLFAADGARSDVDEERRWERIEPLLEGTVERVREGDLHGAWANYRRAYELAGDSELLGLRRAAYCRRARCPGIHDLARLLGKARSELHFLADACPDTTDHRCRRWAATLRDGAAYLGDQAADPAPEQAVEIELLFADEDDPRPWAVVEIGGEAMWAMVDTGGVRLNLPMSWGQRQSVGFLPVEGIFHGTDTDGVVRRGRHGVLPAFGLGTLELGRVAVKLNSGAASPRVGMDILLRYDSVCFEWPDPPSGVGRLHLGSVGPCLGGEVADYAFLLPRTRQPLVEVAMNDGTRVPVLVDTGALYTDCKEEFLAQYRGAPLRFGRNPALAAQTCLENPFPVHPAQHFAVAVGMDTLLKFKAFGWELDPFRMYFVPKVATPAHVP